MTHINHKFTLLLHDILKFISDNSRVCWNFRWSFLCRSRQPFSVLSLRTLHCWDAEPSLKSKIDAVLFYFSACLIQRRYSNDPDVAAIVYLPTRVFWRDVLFEERLPQLGHKVHRSVISKSVVSYICTCLAASFIDASLDALPTFLHLD